MRKLLWVFLCLIAVPAAAQDANGWQMLARTDAQAALALIAEHHPGAAPELGDKEFQSRLAQARAHVAERLPRVESYGGYAALMQGLATDFRDGHIWSNATDIGWVRRRWAGLAIVRRGGQWVVGAQQAADGEPALEGARLLSCDGHDADGWARGRIGRFGGNPAIEADMARRAPTLLLDDGNPFIERPGTCVFATATGEVTLTLKWRAIAQAQLQPVMVSALRPAQAGMGVSAFTGGYWIALQTMNASAADVVEAVRAQRDALRAAAMVVIDLRGNGGGNSAYGSEIAELLAGKARIAAAGSSVPACSGAFWRASPDNLQTLELLTARDTSWAAVKDDMEKALAEKRGFAPALPACARNTAAAVQKPPVRLPASAMRGRLVVLTDRACFSSCLIFTNLLRRMGALHVGEATDMATRYMEVREITLPSGLRTFSTLQKVAVGLGDFGPYVPERIYPGAMDETDAIKAWVAGL
ncbi:S41 family peptidase [Sphingomonas soli]|uniref:S41 family peptidase n=1 Tax=Sphingomonas soli TaxID=266127 RepID=UPI00082D7DE2|nr:S41 family peptidase [Sphingomonas soli]